MMPLVSVIVPAYNCASFIEQSIQSILAQKYPNIEIIVIDDGSTDQSTELARHFGEPIKVILQTNQGPAAARNRGIRESKGEFIAFLDSDDVWLPNKLADQVTFLQENQDIGIIYGTFTRWLASKNGCYPPAEQFVANENDSSFDAELSGWIYHKLLLDNYIHIITAVIRRSLYDKLGGFDESLRTGEDYDFWLRASRITQVYKFSRTVALYRTNPDSTTNVPRPTNNELLVLQRATNEFGLSSPNGKTISSEEMNERLFRLCFGHAYLHFWKGSSCIAKQNFKEAKKYSPRNYRLLIYTMLSGIKCFLKIDDRNSITH
ncbi:MAG: glycosyltransferase [Gammaproteobacteria bacterium]|nr:glycosyltransferase [Gammaproteobacteria bacterium]